MDGWKQKISKYGALYAAVLTFFCMLIILGVTKELPGQKQTIFRGDLYAQVVPFARAYANMLRSGGNFYYSKYLGMGGATIMVQAFYAMSPINLIYVLIQEDLLATVLVEIIKPVLAATFFFLFAKKELKSADEMTVLFGVCYGLCGYGFGVMGMPPIIDCLYYLPLILMLVGRFAEKKKMGALALGYTSLFITHFYAGFLVGLASFYYLIFLLVKKKKERRDVINLMARYVVIVASAFFAAGFLLLPLAFFVITRGGTLESTDFTLANIFEVLSGFMIGKTYEYNTEYAYLFCGLCPIILSPLYFLNAGIEKKERIFTISGLCFLTLAFWIKPINVFLHMGNDPEGYRARYTFMISFVLLCTALRQWEHMKQHKESITEKKILMMSGIWSALFLVSGVSWIMKNPKEYNIITLVCVNIVLILFWGLMIKARFIDLEQTNSLKESSPINDILKKYDCRKMIAGICVVIVCIECSVNGFFTLNNLDAVSSDAYFNATGNYRKALQQIQANDKEQYRIGSDCVLSLNQGVMFEYNGIGYMWASYQPSLLNTMHNLGYHATNSRVSDEGSSAFSRMIFGQKYQVRVEPQRTVVEPQSALPLGYMVCDLPKTEDYMEEEFFYNLELTAKKMTGKEEVGLIEKIEQYGMKPSGATIESSDEYGILVTKQPGTELQKSIVKLSVPSQEDKIAYGLVRGDTLGTGAKLYRYQDALSYQFYRNYDLDRTKLLETDPYGVEENEKNTDENAVYVSLEPGVMQTDLENVQFAYLDKKVLENIYNKLSQNPFEISKFEDGMIEGRVTSTKEKQLFFLSVPYELGWKAYVDGKETEIEPVFGEAFIGLNLSPGEHEISLQFEQPLAKEGKWLSIFGVVMLILLFALDYIKKNKDATEA